jgi:hypothetical protein
LFNPEPASMVNRAARRRRWLRVKRNTVRDSFKTDKLAHVSRYPSVKNTPLAGESRTVLGLNDGPPTAARLAAANARFRPHPPPMAVCEFFSQMQRIRF